jgi:hypothetical protein
MAAFARRAPTKEDMWNLMLIAVSVIIIPETVRPL